MKRVDFEKGSTLGNILGTALPMLVAQIINLLYNIVDRIYIARISEIGTVALGAVGLCFPLVILITAFTNMFGKRMKKYISPSPEIIKGWGILVYHRFLYFWIVSFMRCCGLES